MRMMQSLCSSLPAASPLHVGEGACPAKHTWSSRKTEYAACRLADSCPRPCELPTRPAGIIAPAPSSRTRGRCSRPTMMRWVCALAPALAPCHALSWHAGLIRRAWAAAAACPPTLHLVELPSLPSCTTLMLSQEPAYAWCRTYTCFQRRGVGPGRQLAMRLPRSASARAPMQQPRLTTCSCPARHLAHRLAA